MDLLDAACIQNNKHFLLHLSFGDSYPVTSVPRYSSRYSIPHQTIPILSPFPLILKDERPQTQAHSSDLAKREFSTSTHQEPYDNPDVSIFRPWLSDLSSVFPWCLSLIPVLLHTFWSRVRLFSNSFDLSSVSSSIMSTRLSCDISRVNKLVNMEATPVFYSQNQSPFGGRHFH